MEKDTTENKKSPKTNEDQEKKRGLVYLSCIPRGMTVKNLRQKMEEFGDVGNMYLEPDDKAPFHAHQRAYKEGWVEFQDKKAARAVATMLNNNQVGGRRKNPWREDIWNIKYLPKFKWSHLNARLAYERGVYKQRLRADISQIKREATFHKNNFKKNKMNKKSQQKDGEEGEEKTSFTVKQKETEQEILSRKRKQMEESEGERKKLRQGRRERKTTGYRPDATHPVAEGSLGANLDLLRELFSGGSAD